LAIAMQQRSQIRRLPGRFLTGWLRQLPLGGKFTVLFTLVVVVLAVEFGNFYLSLKIMSGIRAWVAGEDVWTKAQKRQANALQRYSTSHDEADFAMVAHALGPNLGDHNARIAMEKPDMDYAYVRSEFLKGGIHPDDIDDTIFIFRKFRHIVYIEKAVFYWTSADSRIEAFLRVSQRVHDVIAAPYDKGDAAERARRQAAIVPLMKEAYALDDELTGFENHFAGVLGEGSRAIRLILLAVTLVLSLVLGIFVVWIGKLIQHVTLQVEEAKNELRILEAREISEQLHVAQMREQSALLEEQNRSVIEASRLKSEFLANMSHELRTPLNAILGFAQLLQDGEVPAESKEGKEFLGDIVRSGWQLLGLINDVLDLAKVESGKMAFQPETVNVAQIMTEIMRLQRTRAKSLGLELTLEADPELPEVQTDPVRLTQIVNNYLSNALKFSPAGSSITLRAMQSGPDAFRIEVQDNGIGISAHDIDRLFVEFQQLEAGAAKRHAGTGLGLALTRRLVEAQGGSVGVRSEPGKGSTFHAILPRRPLSGRARSGVVAVAEVKAKLEVAQAANDKDVVN
jgi:signal transduction histidine kinase